ncbi:MAG: ArsA-related P-loop ATPase [Microthrixaceae bacterium]
MSTPTGSLGGPHDEGRSAMRDIASTRGVVLCCGSGGVGKTTTAAAIALEAAALGRSAVVVTIDPAKRLADALGIGELSNTATLIEGDWPGELWALMLDTERTFNGLVARYAGSAEQAEKILANTFYRNIAGALSGTQEYMATEKLYELHAGGAFDLIVVDTPPSRHALDFLDAPGRLTRFLNHPLYRLVTAPTRGVVRAVNVAAQPVLRGIAKAVGGEVIADALAFFTAFDGMEEGFKERAAQVERLIADPGTAFVLVASPRSDTVTEAVFFAERLQSRGLTVAAVVVNRLFPLFDDLQDRKAIELDPAMAGRLTNYDQLRAIATGERAEIAPLISAVGDGEPIEVPLLPFEVTDLESLADLGRFLFDPR